jgi:hypothetical protein
MLEYVIAQPIKAYNRPGNDCYCKSVYLKNSTEPRAVVVLDMDGLELTDLDSINPFVGSPIYHELDFLFLNIEELGNADVMDCYERVISTSAFVHRHYMDGYYLLSKPSILLQRGAQTDPTPTKYKLHPFDPVAPAEALVSIAALSKGKNVNVPPDGLDMTYRSMRMRNYKNNLDVGLGYGQLFLTGNELGLNRTDISAWSLSLTKSVHDRHAVRGRLGISFKMPNQKQLQGSMQSQVMSAVQNDQDTLYIDQTISGHIMLGAELGYRYYGQKREAMRTFLGVGYGSYALTRISGTLRDTLDLTDIDISDPSSMQDAIGGGDSDDIGLLQERVTYTVASLEVGFEYRFSPSVKFGVTLPVQFFDPWEADTRTLLFGIQAHLTYTLNSGRSMRTR